MKELQFVHIIDFWPRLLVSVIIVLWYFCLPGYGFCSYGMTAWVDFLGHVLYPLCHVNIWHLLVNIICLWMIPCRFSVCCSYVIGVLCSFLPCFCSEVTMGLSGVLFCIVGMSWGRVGRFRDMFWRNKWFLFIPLFLPHVNGLLHIYCMVGGYLAGYYEKEVRVK